MTIPAIAIFARLCFRMEGMTELINGTFIEDLTSILSSCTGDAKSRKTFHEIDKDFVRNLQKNFATSLAFSMKTKCLHLSVIT